VNNQEILSDMSTLVGYLEENIHNLQNDISTKQRMIDIQVLMEDISELTRLCESYKQCVKEWCQ